MKFQGEMMTCVMCRRRKRSNPNLNSDWRYIDTGSKGYYVCPKHFPDDATGTKAQFEAAYVKILRRIAELESAGYE